jgi:tetratricopeptide (TPR) repeat protein
VYRPLGHSTTVTARRRASQSIVGRRAELATLTSQLEALAHGGAGGTVVIEGEPGIGKSRLVEEIEHNAGTLKIRTMMGAADSIERATSYYAWRGVVSTLLDLDRLTAPDDRRTRVRTLLEPEPPLLRLAPLLNSVLPLDLPENDATRQMTGQVRADNTHDLLLALLQKAAASGPLLVIVEDAHWKDSASWAFTRLVARDVKPLLLVLATRPIAAPIPLEYTQILERGALRMTLDTLAPEEAIALACRRLGVEALPEPVAALISDRAGGNPFFTEELTYALRDAGHIIVDDGACALAPGVDVQAIALPDTVEGVVSERIDRLTSDQQISLKVASVVGRVFPERILHDIHPVDAARDQIAEHLRVLRTLDLTPLEARDPERLYVFKHIITQQVAYNLMLFSQRRELHRRIAEWHEQEYAADLSPFYPALAHHYTMAEESAKAIAYLEKAGERAVRNFANEEAIEFFNQALALDEKAAVPSAPSRCAVWEEQLGEAYYALGKFGQSLEHLNRALTLLKRRPPGALWQHAVSLLAGTLRQTAHRLAPQWFVKAPGPETPLLLVAARANERLCQLYYIQNAKVQSMNGAVTALNLAEAAGPSPELARSYSNVSVTAALIPAYALSDMYERLALATGKAVGHTPSLAYAYEVVGLYHLGAGHWTPAEERVSQSIALAEQIGDRRRWDEAAFIAAVTIHRQGRFAEAKQRFDEIYAAGRRRGIVQVQIWGLTGRLALSLATGQDHEAYGLLDALMTEHGDRTDSVARADAILAFGILAQAHLRAGDLRKARQAAERVVHVIAESETISVYLVAGYQGLGEVLASLRDAERAPMLRPTVKTFRSFARMYPVGRPMAYLWRGVFAWHDGHQRKARRLLAKSLAWGERLGMRYDVAVAHREIARLDTTDAAARSAHIEKARALFAELGAANDLRQLAKL